MRVLRPASIEHRSASAVKSAHGGVSAELHAGELCLCPSRRRVPWGSSKAAAASASSSPGTGLCQLCQHRTQRGCCRCGGHSPPARPGGGLRAASATATAASRASRLDASQGSRGAPSRHDRYGGCASRARSSALGALAPSIGPCCRAVQPELRRVPLLLGPLHRGHRKSGCRRGWMD